VVVQVIHQITKNFYVEEVMLSAKHYFTLVQHITNFLPNKGN
jgi:hypothetical protein